jgi:hypothetical protein
VAIIISVSEFFLISLAFGVGCFTFLIDTEKTGSGLMRLFSSILGTGSFLALLIHLFRENSNQAQMIAYGITTIGFVLIYFFHKEEKNFLSWSAYALHTVAGAAAIYFGSVSIQDFLYLLSSALFLGGVTFAMMKGHWYLVTPKLSEAPLAKSVLGIWGLLGIKIAITAFGVYIAWDFFQQYTRLGEGYLFNWIMLTMRLVWGYLVILVMSIFAWKLVKMRSIQSATGIFYAMVIFVFIGELISGYLFFKYGLYI